MRIGDEKEGRILTHVDTHNSSQMKITLSRTALVPLISSASDVSPGPQPLALDSALLPLQPSRWEQTPGAGMGKRSLALWSSPDSLMGPWESPCSSLACFLLCEMGRA